MHSLLMTPCHACSSQFFREPKTNTSSWVFHKPDSAFSRLFVFTRSTNSSLDTQLLQSFTNLLYKRERDPGTSIDASAGAASCLLASFLCKHLKSKLPPWRASQHSPGNLTHSGIHTSGKKIKFWTGGGKEIMGHSHHTQREALIILCSLSFS